MNTASREWCDRVAARNAIEVAKAQRVALSANTVVRMPMRSPTAGTAMAVRRRKEAR